MIARGLGRSYNNAAQCDGGVVISTARLNRIIELDTATGLATCEAGVSLEQLMVAGLPAGWFVPVSPGTRQVTVGGAIAADVHGKNHHVAGSFAMHVPSFDLLLPGGELRTVTRQADPALFWATAGGMGLTGLIVRATVRLKPVATSRVRVDTVRTADIDETMAVLAEHDRALRLHRRLVGQPGPGRQPGPVGGYQRRLRGAGRPAAGRQGGPVRVPARCPAGRARPVPARADQPLHGGRGQRGVVPQGAAAAPAASCRPSGSSSTRWTASGTGTVSTARAASGSTSTSLPFGQEAAVRRSFELVSQARAPSFVTVLKRFGPGDPGPLSFPDGRLDARAGLSRRAPPGWPGCLACWTSSSSRPEAASTWPRTPGCPPTCSPRMYPRLDEFRKLRAELDPDGILGSDLSRRLGL